MYGEVLRHETGQRWVPTAVLGLALGAFAFFGVAISGSLGAALDELSRSMPEALRAFVGGEVPGGYVVGEIFTLVTPIVLVTYAVLAGAGAVAGEERAGTMALLSAQPVTRTCLLLSKAGAVLMSLVVIAVIFWAGMALAAVIFESELTPGALAAGTTHLLFLGLAFAAIALALGAGTGHTGIAAGTAGVLAVISYLSSSMLPLAGLESWSRLSPWHYALGSDPLRHGLEPAHLGVFTIIIVVSMGVGLLGLNRRDLKG